MERLLRWWLVLGSVTVVTACAQTLPPAMVKPLSYAEKAAQPVWRVGDRWTYKGLPGIGTIAEAQAGYIRTREDEVIRKEGEFYVLRSDPSGDQRVETYVTETLAVKKQVGEWRGERNSTPAFEYYRWPLEVGKRWSAETEVTWGGQSPPPRSRLTVEIVVEEAYEEITVPAGTFRAFRLRDTFPEGDSVRWYAPAVKNWVRIEFPHGKGGWELVSFRLASAE